MPTIKTERLVLRPFEISDLHSTHEYAGDVGNAEYMVYLPNKNIDVTRDFIERAITELAKEKPQFYEFAITLDGCHIGGCSVYLGDDRKVGELGWIVHKAYHGNGYATEAARAVMDFAIAELKTKKIKATCDYRNKSSYRVMEKIGLTLEDDTGVRPYKDGDKNVQELLCSLIIE